jgi:hypothetical protein
MVRLEVASLLKTLHRKKNRATAMQYKILRNWMPLLLVTSSFTVGAALPPPTPAQAAAAVVKKSQADAQAKQAQIALTASMEDVTRRWRANATNRRLTVYPPVALMPAPIVAASAVLTVPVKP